ncbi:MAG: DoxX family membrane protein [Bacteroidia bacterium]|nr:DoxX family membrane protein [Bacteroidia bacterium]
MELKYPILELGIRVLVACLFIFQGYDKLFKLGIGPVYQYFSEEFEKINFHSGLSKTLISISSWVEFIGGILLLVGLFRIYVLEILLAEVVIISVFFSVLKPMWDMKFVWPRLVLIVFLIIIPSSWAKLSIDNFINNNL